MPEIDKPDIKRPQNFIVCEQCPLAGAEIKKAQGRVGHGYYRIYQHCEAARSFRKFPPGFPVRLWMTTTYSDGSDSGNGEFYLDVTESRHRPCTILEEEKGKNGI